MKLFDLIAICVRPTTGRMAYMPYPVSVANKIEPAAPMGITRKISRPMDMGMGNKLHCQSNIIPAALWYGDMFAGGSKHYIV